MTDRTRVRTDPGALVSGLAAKLNELEQAGTRQNERFSAVIDVGTQLSSARDVDALLRTVMDRLTGLLEAEAATLFMHDPKTNEPRQDVVGDPPKILRCRTRGALLLREGAAELLFAQRFDLEQTGSEPPPDDLLIAQRAQELVPRDLATLLEKLTQAECSSAQRTS